MSRGTQLGRLKDDSGGLHFIISDPSNKGNSKSQSSRVVRSHVGKWTWENARKSTRRKERRSAPKGPGQDVADDDANPWMDRGDTSDSALAYSTGASSSPQSMDPWLDDLVGSSESSSPPSLLSPRSSIDMDTLDPFHSRVSSPISPDLVSSTNKYSLSVLWPGLMPSSRTGATHAGVQGWFTSSTVHPALHSAMLYGSYSHRRTRWVMKRQGHFNYEDMREMAVCEANVISQMNSILQDPIQAASDAVILSVLCLATNLYNGPSTDEEACSSPFYAPLRSLQWLDIYGRLSPHPVHQAGLLQLISLRGGLEKMELPGLAAVISFSSILGASKSLSRPPLPFISLQTGRQATLPHTIEKTFSSAPSINRDPLLDIHIPTEMLDVFRGMRAYVSLIEAYQDGVDGGADNLTLCDTRNLVQWHVMALAPASELGPLLVQFCPVYEACRLALVIFGVGVTFPLPPGVALFAQLASAMRVEMQGLTADRAMQSVSSMQAYCWCLVLSGIVAEVEEERRWFVQELKQTLAALRVSTWAQLKRELRSFLWLDSACDAAGRQLWGEIERSD
ncbi:hypothetical protein BJX68DRAFT_230926 [Aspergillus pseudodeflectus]|uniref:Fungal-specific transcription factor domain-containing protein n=1 Tax=Aspergillus pseudodeflectus TaxID=176178 RepID=A0ABR4KWI0_9EURO